MAADGIGREGEIGKTVETVGSGSLNVIAHAEIQGETLVELPIVVNIPSEVLLAIGGFGGVANAATVTGSEEERGDAGTAIGASGRRIGSLGEVGREAKGGLGGVESVQVKVDAHEAKRQAMIAEVAGEIDSVAARFARGSIESAGAEVLIAADADIGKRAGSIIGVQGSRQAHLGDVKRHALRLAAFDPASPTQIYRHDKSGRKDAGISHASFEAIVGG